MVELEAVPEDDGTGKAAAACEAACAAAVAAAAVAAADEVSGAAADCFLFSFVFAESAAMGCAAGADEELGCVSSLDSTALSFLLFLSLRRLPSACSRAATTTCARAASAKGLCAAVAVTAKGFEGALEDEDDLLFLEGGAAAVLALNSMLEMSPRL